MSLQRIVQVFCVLAVSGVMLTACASRGVSSYAMRGFDVRQFPTYSWGPADALSTGDPRLDNNEFFIRRVREQIDAELTRRGFEKITGRQPDLLLHFHASVTQQIDTRVVDTGYVNHQTTEGGAYVFDAGTLFIDFVDPRTNTLVWRGWAEGRLDGAIDDQASMDARVDESVRHILQRLP